MADPVPIDGYHQLRRDIDQLMGGGSGGTSGGMEARIARLEADMGHVKSSIDRLDRGLEAVRVDTTKLREDMASVTAKIEQLPTVGKIWTAAGATIAALGIIVAMIVHFIPAAH